MDNNKNFDRLFESAKDSAHRQDEVFNRIQDIVKEHPESAKGYLKELTNTSKWELYGRIYSKFAAITLLIAFLIAGLITGIKKLNGASEKSTLESFVALKPTLKLSQNNDDKFYVQYCDSDILTTIGALENFIPSSGLISQKNNNGWNILKDKFNVGSLELNISEFSMDFDDEQYKINTPHAFGSNSHFLFNVDAVNNVIKQDSVVSIIYLVRFGESISGDTIWQDKPIRIKKSADARGLIGKGRSNLFQLSHSKWQNTYFIEISLGNNCEGDIYKLYGNGYAIGLK